MNRVIFIIRFIFLYQVYLTFKRGVLTLKSGCLIFIVAILTSSTLISFRTLLVNPYRLFSFPYHFTLHQYNYFFHFHQLESLPHTTTVLTLPCIVLFADLSIPKLLPYNRLLDFYVGVPK